MRPGFDPWVGKIPWRRGRLPTLVFWPRKIPETKNQKIWHPWSLPLGIRWLKQKWLTSLLGMSFPCSFIHSFSTFWAYFLVTFGFPGGLDGKESACNAWDLGSIPGLGRPPGGGHGHPLQYSCLENPHGVRKSQTRLLSCSICAEQLSAAHMEERDSLGLVG